MDRTLDRYLQAVINTVFSDHHSRRAHILSEAFTEDEPFSQRLARQRSAEDFENFFRQGVQALEAYLTRTALEEPEILYPTTQAVEYGYLQLAAMAHVVNTRFGGNISIPESYWKQAVDYATSDQIHANRCAQLSATMEEEGAAPEAVQQALDEFNGRYQAYRGKLFPNFLERMENQLEDALTFQERDRVNRAPGHAGGPGR